MMEMKTMNHDFIIGPCDTDSISFAKSSMKEFSKEEIDSLIKELNDLSPEFMDWDNDGYYPSCIAVRAKNYVLFDGKKKTVKGSAFKTSSKEIALGEMMQEMVDEMLRENRTETLINIYHKYIKEALNPTNIHRWSQKKTITKPILDCKHDSTARLNERKVYDAVKDRVVQEGDKVYVYPAIMSLEKIITPQKNGKFKEKIIKEVGLKLDTDYSNDHDSEKLIERVYDTICILENIIDLNRFTNYTLVKNKPLLTALESV